MRATALAMSVLRVVLRLRVSGTFRLGYLTPSAPALDVSSLLLLPRISCISSSNFISSSVSCVDKVCSWTGAGDGLVIADGDTDGDAVGDGISNGVGDGVSSNASGAIDGVGCGCSIASGLGDGDGDGDGDGSDRVSGDGDGAIVPATVGDGDAELRVSGSSTIPSAFSIASATSSSNSIGLFGPPSELI